MSLTTIIVEELLKGINNLLITFLNTQSKNERKHETGLFDT